MVTAKRKFLKRIGKKIVALRKERGISQAELARLCFKDPQSIERIENGKVNTSIYFLQEIANGLGVDVKEFL